MRKFVLFLTMFCLCCVAFAQKEPLNFWGIEIGRGTCSELKEVVEGKGFKFLRTTKDGAFYVGSFYGLTSHIYASCKENTDTIKGVAFYVYGDDFSPLFDISYQLSKQLSDSHPDYVAGSIGPELPALRLLRGRERIIMSKVVKSDKAFGRYVFHVVYLIVEPEDDKDDESHHATIEDF